MKESTKSCTSVEIPHLTFMPTSGEVTDECAFADTSGCWRV
jgi:hypothetical protein